MLALRMGLPIFLLLITSLVIVATPDLIQSEIFQISLLLISVLTIVYYIFYLLNQSATSTTIDQLTKAFNRENLFIEIYKAQKKGFLNSISLIQIKNISQLNDHYGYEKTDKILAEFVKSLNLYLESTKDLPIIGRLQGSDFVIGSVQSPQDMKNLLLAFQKSNNEFEGVSLEIQSAVSVNSNDIRKNIEHLYDSLHQKIDKQSKNEIYIQDIQNLTKLEKEIVQSVHNSHLQIYFKPVRNIKNGKMDIYEAIIKLKTPSFGVLPTRKYIPVINRLDLEQSFDLAIASHISQVLLQADENISISFNISPFSLRSQEFGNKLFELISSYGVDPKRYIIELYENKVYHDLQAYTKTLNRLKGFGVRLCLDNFGAMNASLEYIKCLPIDFVQFDNQFSKNLDQPSYKATLKAFIGMCDDLEITTILKWIDDREQKVIATELGVTYIQGFYVGKLKKRKDL